MISEALAAADWLVMLLQTLPARQIRDTAERANALYRAAGAHPDCLVTDAEIDSLRALAIARRKQEYEQGRSSRRHIARTRPGSRPPLLAG